jgi:hypothetical protein
VSSSNVPVVRVHDDANAENYLITTADVELIKGQKVLVNIFFNVPADADYTPSDPAIFLFDDIQASGVERSISTEPFKSSYTYNEIIAGRLAAVSSTAIKAVNGKAALFALSGPGSTFVDDDRSSLSIVGTALIAKPGTITSHFT